MNCDNCVKLLPGKEVDCVWHKKYIKTGKNFKHTELFPNNVCPILYHTLYPYFLGALFGAKYAYNEYGDCQVCCPAFEGVDVIVKVRANDGKFPKGVDEDWINVIYAEIIAVRGKCDYNHKVGDRIVFPTTRSMRTQHICPAGLHNFFPFLDLNMYLFLMSILFMPISIAFKCASLPLLKSYITT